MTFRERFRQTFLFGTPDRPFYMPHWFWSSTIERWHNEGLPRDQHLDAFFGFDRYEVVPINLGLVPAFDVEVYYEDDEYRIYRRGDGCIVKEYKRRPEMSMPQWLEFSLNDRNDWERHFVPRLNPHSPARYPVWWDDYVRRVRNRDYPLGVHAGSYYGWIRNWMGLERLSEMVYDDPRLVRDIAEYIADFVIETIKRAVDEVKPDFALMWEDMAMKTGPLISPGKFEELMIPACRRVCQFLHDKGVDIILLDSDGYVDPLIPLWLKAGVTGIYPLEIASGEDPVKLRKEYGKRLMMFGGVDKRVLAQGHEAIKMHLFEDLKLPWLFEQGGYTAFVDHAVPPDVSFDNFCYYWDLVRSVAEGQAEGSLRNR